MLFRRWLFSTTGFPPTPDNIAIIAPTIPANHNCQKSNFFMPIAYYSRFSKDGVPMPVAP